MGSKNSLIYFEPGYVDLVINENCFPKLIFVAKKGTIIEGSVTPALEDVLVKATSQAD